MLTWRAAEAHHAGTNDHARDRIGGAARALRPSAAAQPRYPGTSWDRAASPEQMGWSSDKLHAALEYAATLHTATLMVIADGVVLDEWGETTRRFDIHSIRKSLLSALYGIHVKEGRIRLGKTLGEVGVDDNEPALTALEKRATVVVVHRVNTDIQGRNVSHSQFGRSMQLILDAKK